MLQKAAKKYNDSKQAANTGPTQSLKTQMQQKTPVSPSACTLVLDPLYSFIAAFKKKRKMSSVCQECRACTCRFFFVIFLLSACGLGLCVRQVF